MKILVTGASGFIGSRLCELLLSRGHQVRAQYRRPVLDGPLADLAEVWPGLECVRCNLDAKASLPPLDGPAFRHWKQQSRTGIPAQACWWEMDQGDREQAIRLLEGVDAIAHVAGLASDWGPWPDFFAANTNSLMFLAQGALASPRHPVLLLTSSISVHGFGQNLRNTEDGQYFKVDNPYQLSKRMAESLLAEVQRRGLVCGIVRPGNVYGPGDTTTFYPMFEKIRQGIMGTAGGGHSRTCPIHVEDLCTWMARGLDLLAQGTISAPHPPPVWNLANVEPVTWRELLDCICQAMGRPARYPNLPAPLGLMAAGLLEALYGLLRRPRGPDLTRYRLAQVIHDYDFDPARACRDLGGPPRWKLEDGMAETVAAWKALGN